MNAIANPIKSSSGKKFLSLPVKIISRGKARVEENPFNAQHLRICNMQFSLWMKSRACGLHRNPPRNGVIHEYWLKANGAKEFKESHPRFHETLSKMHQTHVHVLPSNLICPSRIESSLSDEQGISVDSLCSLVGDNYASIAQMRFIRSFIAILVIHFTVEESLAILHGIANRSKHDSRRPFITQSTKYMEWALYQLARFIKSPSLDQVAIFVRFVVYGDADKLPSSQLTRLVGCFLYEGCKVLVRLGIAFLLLDETSRGNDDLLFNKAFQLRISSRTFPLSEKRRVKARRLWIPALSEPVQHELRVPHISNLCDLSQVVKQSMDALELSYIILAQRQVDLVAASRNDGTSSLLFTGRLNAAIASDAVFVLAVFKTTTDVLSLAITHTSFVMLDGSNAAIVRSREKNREDELVRVTGEFLTILDGNGEPVFLTDKQLTRISLGNASDLALVNYEIFQFI